MRVKSGNRACDCFFRRNGRTSFKLCRIQWILVIFGCVSLCWSQSDSEIKAALKKDRYNVVEVMRWKWPDSTRPCPPAKLFYRRCHWKSQHSGKSAPPTEHHIRSFRPLLPAAPDVGNPNSVLTGGSKQVALEKPRIVVDASGAKGSSHRSYLPLPDPNTINKDSKGQFGKPSTEVKPDAIVSLIAEEGYISPFESSHQPSQKKPTKWLYKVNRKKNIEGEQRATWRPMVFSSVAPKGVGAHNRYKHQRTHENSQTKHSVVKTNRGPHGGTDHPAADLHKTGRSISKKELDYVHRVLEKLWDLYRIGISFHQEPSVSKEPTTIEIHHQEKECYRLLRRNQRLDSRILQSLQLQQLSQCEQACTDDHRCISFNFRSDSGTSICELADSDSHTRLARFSERSGWNFYEREASSYCSGWDHSFYQQHNYGYAYCSLRVQANLRLNVNSVLRDIAVRNLYECEQACRDEQQFRCETFSFGLSLPGNQLSCQLSDRRVSDLSPRDTLAQPNFEIYDFHGNGRGCDRSDDQYDYRHGHVFTCSGQQCARGPCRIDRAGGFWYCFTDANDAVWDYCCDPDSGCQTEPRMTMPTCYVTQQRGVYRNAATDTAWRPCTQQPAQRFAFLTRTTNSSDWQGARPARRNDNVTVLSLPNTAMAVTGETPAPREGTKFTLSSEENKFSLN